jgi:hypothetical protein
VTQKNTFHRFSLNLFSVFRFLFSVKRQQVERAERRRSEPNREASSVSGKKVSRILMVFITPNYLNNQNYYLTLSLHAAAQRKTENGKQKTLPYLSYLYAAAQAPSVETMQGPKGWAGVQIPANKGHSTGRMTPRRTSPQRQGDGGGGVRCSQTWGNRNRASKRA